MVGLVCIRIFGYSDPAAEKLAEETGVAFQLTNILRDVAEDAERSRVYLPLEDLAAHNVSLQSLFHRAKNAPPTSDERALLDDIGRRAESYYGSAQKLLPLIDRESRPALWVLVSIYHALLKTNSQRRLRCVFAPGERADGTKGRNSRCGNGARGSDAACPAERQQAKASRNKQRCDHLRDPKESVGKAVRQSGNVVCALSPLWVAAWPA